MMNVDIINKINDSPYKAYVAIVGGGQTFIGNFCSISGASKTLVGATVPYDRNIFDKFVKEKMTEYASPLAARKLALASFQECILAGIDAQYAIGIGSANSIAYDGEREGRTHKINIAIHTVQYTKVVTLYLVQARLRIEEENLIADLIYKLLAKACGIDINIIPNGLYAHETFDVKFQSNEDARRIIMKDSGMYISDEPRNNTINIYSGSFNPKHAGHDAIYDIASKVFNGPVYYELTIHNADKGMLDFVDINERLKQFIGVNQYILTAAPTTKQKIDIIKNQYPDVNINIAMGVDTWNRIWDVKYGYEPKFLETYFANQKVKFLVFGRNGIIIDRTYGKELLIEDENAINFNMPISSSEIRNKK